MFSFSTMPRRRGPGRLALVLAFGFAPAAGAQEPSPSPPAPRALRQDDPDQRGRSSLALGSGARALGMGGAFLSRADDATAASWNPAGLSYLKWPEVTAVGVRNTFRNTATNTGGGFVERDSLTGYTPDFLAVTYPVNLASRSGSIQVSFQRVLSYDADRTIRLADRTFELQSSGGFDVLAFGTGFQAFRWLRVGGTLNRWFNGFHQETDRLGLGRGSIRLLQDFEISGWNVNGGFIVSPFESLNLGAVVKTSFTGDVTLTRRRFDTPTDGNATNNFFRSNSVRLDFPGAAGVGLSWRPAKPLTMSLDYTRTLWSKGRIRNYFTLPVQGEPTASTGSLFESLPFPVLLTAKKQADTGQIRVGVEYVLLRGRLKVPLRAGYFRDSQHFPSADTRPPLKPGRPARSVADVVFNGFTAGAGAVIGPVLLDAAFVVEDGRYNDVTGNRVDTSIRRLFVSIIYRRGGS